MLLLDSEALSALAHGPVARRQRVLAVVADVRSLHLPIATVSAVLSEVVRGRPADAAVFAALRRHRLEIHPVDRRVAVRAGGLLGAVGAGSELAIDAFVVAVGDLGGGAIIVTADPDDLRSLAVHCDTQVSIVDI